MSEDKMPTKTHLDHGMLMFHCPGCEFAHGPPVAGDRKWEWNGDHEKPTLSPSLLCRDGQGLVCHSFIRDGKIQFLDDCTHALKGQTVDIPDWDSE